MISCAVSTSPQTEQWLPSVRPVFTQSGATAESISLVWPSSGTISAEVSTAPQTEQLILDLLCRSEKPVVLDADGINVLSGNIDVLRQRKHPTILTPHAGEFARLGGVIGPDRVESARQFARENPCVLLLKGHRTVITDGEECYVNHTGNPGMAVGGSGDVLSGIITSLLGQGLPPLTAAACGAWLHGKAGDLCAEKMGQYGLLPSDMVEVLPRLLK